jgi:ABC-type multidrug transport system fused ATPase/permease subunit
MRNAMSIVLQEGFLFSGTVFDNIRMGRLKASENEIIEAAKTARAWDFIQTLPEGMETLVGERGMKLSGGQKQLLAMARAVLRNASIVLLDEPTSALDSETESLVQKSMSVLRQKSAVIIIAHRLSTIRSADEILAIHKGEIIERGTHEALLAQNGYYTRLYKLQFGTRAE